jgi:hypothetical protein
MRIELQRTEAPEDMQPDHCGICGQLFEVGVVRAQVVVLWEQDGGVACEQCIEYFGNYRPDVFPSLAEYRRLERQWGTPEYASVRELEAAERALG